MPGIYVPSRGNPEAKIMFVGEAPGAQEEIARKPFIGPAGNVLTELILKAGIDPDDCYFTNISKYRPPENDLSKWITKGVPNDTILAGVDELIAEVEQVNPNVIVPLGNWPLWFFYGQKLNKQHQATGISNYRGYVTLSRRICRGRKIIPSFHPSYYLQGGYGEAGLGLFDLRKVSKESASPTITRVPRRHIIDPRGQERDDIHRRLLAEGPILFTDIEYVGRRLICVGFAVDPSWAVTWRIRDREDIAFVKSLIESGKPIGAQNATYDLGQLEWHFDIHGFDNLVYDTMVAAYVLNIEHQKDLGFLGSMYTDLDIWWDVVDWDKIRDGKQDPDVTLDYNCDDNIVTCEVAQKQQVELASDPKMQEAFNFDMEKVRELWKISKRGMPIDFGKLKDLREKVTLDYRTHQDTLNDVATTLGMDLGGKDLNVAGKIQIPELLAAWLDIELTKRTDGGKFWATDNMTLTEYARRYPQHKGIIECILRVRESRGIEEKFLNIEWDTDGRARCIYDPTKTVTRRLSSKTFFPTEKGDNLQNIPAPNSSPRYGGLVRGCFVPDEGLKFGYADLKGAEFLIVAWLTQDPLMLKYAQMSIDGTGNVHKETAALMFNRPASSIDKESVEYFLGKKMRHSGNYLIGWKELMGRINGEAMETGVFVDAKTTKLMIEGYIGMHPGLPVWWDEVRYEAKSTGRLRNLFGFPRVVNDKVDRCLPALVAFKPQSTVGDALNYGLLACAKDEELREYKFEILLNVHDAIGFQYHPEYEGSVLPRVRALMSKQIYIPKTDQMMTIPIEIQTGYAWYPLDDWKEQ